MSHSDASSTPSGQPPASAGHDRQATERPGPGWPSDGANGPARRSGLAIAAFVVGLVSILLCLIPVVNVVSLIGGIVAVVLGIMALRKLVPGVTGKNFAVAGIVLGVLSVVVTVLVWVLLGQALQDAIDSGELDTVLEDAGTAQEATVVEDELLVAYAGE